MRLAPELVADLLTHHPRIARALRKNQLVDEAILREWLTNVGRRSAVERLAHLFCELLLRLKVVGLADGTGYIRGSASTISRRFWCWHAPEIAMTGGEVGNADRPLSPLADDGLGHSNAPIGVSKQFRRLRCDTAPACRSVEALGI